MLGRRYPFGGGLERVVRTDVGDAVVRIFFGNGCGDRRTEFGGRGVCRQRSRGGAGAGAGGAGGAGTSGGRAGAACASDAGARGRRGRDQRVDRRWWRRRRRRLRVVPVQRRFFTTPIPHASFDVVGVHVGAQHGYVPLFAVHAFHQTVIFEYEPPDRVPASKNHTFIDYYQTKI